MRNGERGLWRRDCWHKNHKIGEDGHQVGGSLLDGLHQLRVGELFGGSIEIVSAVGCTSAAPLCGAGWWLALRAHLENSVAKVCAIDRRGFAAALIDATEELCSIYTSVAAHCFDLGQREFAERGIDHRGFGWFRSEGCVRVIF